MSRWMRFGAGALAAALALPPTHAQAQTDPSRVTFVVLGHIRGNRTNELFEQLPQLLSDVRRLRPDAVFICGDMIWGEYDKTPPDRAVITRTWEQLDSALATLGVPVHRVPGNHDINDPVTRDVYYSRYGRPPQSVTLGNSRFLLLNSAWVPEDNAPAVDPRPRVGGVALDSSQIGFIERTLADTSAFQHAFLLTHHLLWFSDSAPWWRDVHPRLRGRKVWGVFSGNLGPMKFAHEVRDSVHYIQTSMEGSPSVEIQRLLLSSRLLAAQFDNYLHVTVAGPTVDVEVKVLGAMTTEKYTPKRWAAVDRQAPPPPVWTRAWALIGSPARLAALACVSLFLMSVGYAIAASRYRRRGTAKVRTAV